VTTKLLQLSDLFSHPANLLALGFGTGLSRYAPGTVGSLLGLPLFLIMPKSALPYVLITGALFALGVYVCDACSQHLGVHDHPAIVWDEIVGMLITLFLVPAELLYMLLAFLMFRLFDILKPWPIGWIDARVHGGLGIMLDDVFAALFALAATHAIIRWLVPLVIKIFG
jgi:phosphatidylglycerophosphatase A